MRSKICLALSLFSFEILFACSTIVLKNETSIYLAKNFDWTYPEGHILKNPRGVSKNAFYTTAGKPMSWISKYGSITFNQNGKEMPYGGINDQGLAIEMLWLDYTEYQSASNLSYLNELEWIQFQLDNHATVAEVIERVSDFSIIPFKGKIHYMVADAQGNSVVIEHIAGKVTYEAKPINQCQAITNFDVSTSEKWYAKPENRLKGNVTNALYRYSKLSAEIANNSFAGNLTEKTAFTILDEVAIRKGGFKTQWSIVYDLGNKLIYFKTANQKNIKEIGFNNLDFNRPVEFVDISVNNKGNINSLFKTYTRAANTQLLKISFTNLGLEKLNFDEVSNHQFDFNSGTDNSYINQYCAIKIRIGSEDNGPLGRLGIAIYQNELNGTFNPYKDATHQILLTGPSYSWLYYGLGQGSYVIGAAQDSNNNSWPDYESEKYAFSNNGRVINGLLPSFDSCKINLGAGIHEISLVLR